MALILYVVLVCAEYGYGRCCYFAMETVRLCLLYSAQGFTNEWVYNA